MEKIKFGIFGLGRGSGFYDGVKANNGEVVAVCDFNEKRLEKAMRLLVESDEKISNIAISCGYNSISYFTEIFTKNINVSPTEFRKKNSRVHFHEFYDYDNIIKNGEVCYGGIYEEITYICAQALGFLSACTNQYVYCNWIRYVISTSNEDYH